MLAKNALKRSGNDCPFNNKDSQRNRYTFFISYSFFSKALMATIMPYKVQINYSKTEKRLSNLFRLNTGEIPGVKQSEAGLNVLGQGSSKPARDAAR